MNKLFVAWRDHAEKKWYPVGMLYKEKGNYYFCYTKGAEAAQNFTRFGMMTDLTSRYSSQELFPFFSNRLLHSNRPEFSDYLEWLGITAGNYDPLEVLALTEGKRGTDSIEIFPYPTKDTHGNFSTSFFSHGIRYLASHSIEALAKLKCGDILYLATDPQNRYDHNAILLRTDDPVNFVGYCPRYLTSDFHTLLALVNPNHINIQVSKININAPLQFRLMCKVTAPWPYEFSPCSDPYFAPLAATCAL
jgi:hypothetical protein